MLRALTAPLYLVHEAWARRRPSAAAHPPVWRAATRQGLEVAAADPQWTRGSSDTQFKARRRQRRAVQCSQLEFPCTSGFSIAQAPSEPNYGLRFNCSHASCSRQVPRAAAPPPPLPAVPLPASLLLHRRCGPAIALTCPSLHHAAGVVAQRCLFAPRSRPPPLARRPLQPRATPRAERSWPAGSPPVEYPKRQAVQTMASAAGAAAAAPPAAASSDAKPLVLVVAVVLLDASGRVLLAQRPPGKKLAGLWEFPGGWWVLATAARLVTLQRCVGGRHASAAKQASTVPCHRCTQCCPPSNKMIRRRQGRPWREPRGKREGPAPACIDRACLPCPARVLPCPAALHHHKELTQPLFALRCSPQAALVRELREELQIEVQPSSLVPLSFASHEYDSFHLLMPTYTCRAWAGEPHGAEGQALTWCSAEELEAGRYEMPPADIPLLPPVLAAMRQAGSGSGAS